MMCGKHYSGTVRSSREVVVQQRSMVPLYSSQKSRITKAWASQFPGFIAWKPKHVLRRHGPLVMGICLDSVRSPDAYQPFFHFHSLMTASKVITLSLSGPLRTQKGAYDEIKVSQHDERLPDCVNRFASQYPLVRRARLTYSEYVRYAAQALLGQGRPYRPHVYRDVILLASFLGAAKHAQTELDALYRDLQHRTDYNPIIIGSPDQWRREVDTSLKPEEKLNRVVSSEIETHGLESVPDSGIDLDEQSSLVELLK